jgi:hypothetical protein
MPALIKKTWGKTRFNKGRSIHQFSLRSPWYWWGSAISTTKLKQKKLSAAAISNLGLAALALLGLSLWRSAFVRAFEGWFLWDDARFRAVAPLSLSDLFLWFGTAVDDNGYYRPFARLLWSWSTAFGARNFSDFQLVSVAMIAGSAACLYFSISRLFGNRPVALAAAAGFAFTGIHLKTLMWTSVWFHEASCFFAAANLALMIMHYEKPERAWARPLSVLALFLAYSTNNGMHSWAIVPLAVDFVLTSRLEDEKLFDYLARVLRKAKDHLLLSLALFTYLYVLHDPFSRQRDIVAWTAYGNAKAFALYVTSSIAHPWGDGPAYTEYPNWLIALSAITILIAAIGYFREKRMLIATAALAGTAFVISLLHGRWQVEYSIPVAMAVALLHGGAVSLAIRRLPWLGWLVAPLWIYGCFIITSEKVAPVFVQSYLADAKVLHAFVDSIQKLDAEEKPGRVFVMSELRGKRLRSSAANAHFVHPAVLLFTPGRAFFLDSKLFQTVEDFGQEEVSSALAVKLLKLAEPPLRLSCDDYGCERAGGQK